MDDVVAVVTDLLFQSRITTAARHLGLSVRYVTTVEQARAVASHRLALVDLDARVDVSQVIELLKRSVRGSVVAFGPHLDAEKLKAARAAGADRALARSKFFSELPTILASVKSAPEDALPA